MWSAAKNEQQTLKDQLFTDLCIECRLAAPGARLSYMIRNKLERLGRNERTEIVCRTKEGCAPLFLASKKGNLEIVEYLIASCEAKVEQRGMYEVPDDRSIHFVTPLWCAAVAGKLAIVKCLVQHGANVNTVSDSGSTPVRSACFMTHQDIVTFLVENGADILKPNHNGGTCLINSVQSVSLCEFLLKHGADVNAQDMQLKTALHYAIQEHRFETTLLLLKHGADPFVQSRYGDDALQTACLKGATEIVNFLLEQLDYSIERCAEAQELLGTTFLDEHHDVQMALLCWKHALNIREIDPDNVIRKPQPECTREAYLHAREFQTPEELENLSYDLDAMHVQSLLIAERILGPMHKASIFRLMYRGAAYADSLQFQRCIDLWRYALEIRVNKDTLIHGEAWFGAQTLVRLFLDIQEKHSMGVRQEQVRYEDVMAIVELLVSQFEFCMELLSVRPLFKRQQDNFDKILKVLMHLFHVLHTMPKTEQQKESMLQLIHRIILINPINSIGDTLLHLTVSKANTLKSNSIFDESHTAVFPSAAITELLLLCGADVEATNHNHSTPLHIASFRLNYRPEVVRVLLKNGAHIDRRNSNGNQPHRMLANIVECNVNVLQHVTLKCLAARKIVERRIPYCGEVPVILEAFIRIH